MCHILGQKLRDWERSHGYNELQAAQAAGIPRSSWQRYKNKPGVIPEGKNRVVLANLLNISVNEVVMIAIQKDPSTFEHT